MNFFMKIGLSYLLNTVSTLSIVAFMVMLNLNYPSNVKEFMGTILQLLNMEAVDSEWLYFTLFNHQF